MLVDLQLTFVPYSREFLARSWVWLNDPETKALTLTPDFTKEQQEAFYETLPLRSDYLIWGVALAGMPIGACGLKHITGTDAEYWGYIGEKQFWGRGLGRQIVEHCEGVARTMNLRRLYLHVGTDNTRGKSLYEKCGFVEVEEDMSSGNEITMRKIV